MRNVHILPRCVEPKRRSETGRHARRVVRWAGSGGRHDASSMTFLWMSDPFYHLTCENPVSEYSQLSFQIFSTYRISVESMNAIASRLCRVLRIVKPLIH
jgi:hypothetical protein